jgi:hypothetical protein
MDSAGNLVDVLTARTLGANCSQFNLAFRDEKWFDDVDPVSASAHSNLKPIPAAALADGKTLTLHAYPSAGQPLTGQSP